MKMRKESILLADEVIECLTKTFGFKGQDFFRLGIRTEKDRCLEICAKYASIEGIAQKIAEEIERGE